MERDNYYETAIANFGEVIGQMESSGAQYSDKRTWTLVHGLRHLAQGLLQNQQAMEARLDVIAKALKPPK